MKITYGSPIPPGLAAPTYGELRVRLEKLLLHLDDCPPGTPLNECEVEAMWWGEDAPSVSVKPSTMDHPRGSATMVFPLKTLRPQLEQYFSHMTVARSGLRLNVVIPTAFSGKKAVTIVGSSLLRLEGLTPTAPITGWINVMNQGESKCIGRMKLHISVQYFSSGVTKRPAGETISDHEFAGPTKLPKAIEESRAQSASKDGHAAAADELPKPAGEGPPPSTGPDPTAAAGGMTATQPAMQAPAEGAAVQSAVEEKPARGVRSPEAKEKGSPSKKKSLDPQILHDIFARGMELREKMVSAARSMTLPRDAEGRPKLNLPLPFAGAAAPTAQKEVLLPFYPQPSGSEHLHEATAPNGGASDTDGQTVSSDTEDEAAAPGDPLDADSKLPIHHFHGAHHLTLLLNEISFARVVTEVRFCLRTSRDVTSPLPVGPVTSPVFMVPLTAPVRLELLIASFSNVSKAVVECFAVTSRFEPSRGVNVLVSETLLGIVVLGLYDQSNRNVFFHDPVSGEDPVEAKVTLAIHALTSGADRDTVLRATQQMMQPPATVSQNMPPSAAQPEGLTTSPTKEEGEKHHRSRRDRRHRHRDRHHHHRPRHGRHPRQDGDQQPAEDGAPPSHAQPTDPQHPDSTNAVVMLHPKLNAAPAPGYTLFSYDLFVIAGRNFPNIQTGLNGSAAPRSFVCVEDIFYSDGALLTTWSCKDDRSAVTPPSCNPKFDFHTRVDVHPGAVTIDPSRLSRMVLSYWVQLSDVTVPTSQTTDGNRIVATTARELEADFWSRSRQIGRAEVPLASLRHLPGHMMDCWIHVYEIESSLETLRRPIGQLKIELALK